MSTALKLHFEVADQVYDRIWNHVRHIPDDFREPFEQMAEEFWKQEAATFAAEGAVGGFKRWVPLKPGYRHWKEKHYPGQPILVLTGALKASLTEPNAEGAIYEVYPTEMQLGTEIPYAIYHQMGGSLHKDENGNIVGEMDHPPRRPPVLLTMGLRTKWTKIVTTWLRDEFAYDGR